MNILVICPTHREYENFNKSFTEYTKKTQADRPDMKFFVVESGMGKVNAAGVTAQQIANMDNFYLIVVIGYAAGDLHYNKGDIVVPTKAQYHDARVPKGFVPEMDQIYELVGGEEDCTILTGDAFVDELMVDHIINKDRNSNHIFDMESCAVAQIAYRFRIPLMVVKMISDVPQNLDTRESYEEFADSHSDFSPIIEKIINYILLK